MKRDFKNEQSKIQPNNGKSNFRKPSASYITLIQEAIKKSPGEGLTLSEIYESLKNDYECFRSNYIGWKNSVRHNLSLNECFIKEAKMKDKTGKSHFWKIDPNARNQFNNSTIKRRPRGFRDKQNKSNSSLNSYLNPNSYSIPNFNSHPNSSPLNSTLNSTISSSLNSNHNSPDNSNPIKSNKSSSETQSTNSSINNYQSCYNSNQMGSESNYTFAPNSYSAQDNQRLFFIQQSTTRQLTMRLNNFDNQDQLNHWNETDKICQFNCETSKIDQSNLKLVNNFNPVSEQFNQSNQISSSFETVQDQISPPQIYCPTDCNRIYKFELNNNNILTSNSTILSNSYQPNTTISSTNFNSATPNYLDHSIQLQSTIESKPEMIPVDSKFNETKINYYNDSKANLIDPNIHYMNLPFYNARNSINFQ